MVGSSRDIMPMGCAVVRGCEVTEVTRVRYLLVDESGTGARYFARSVGSVSIHSKRAMLMEVEGEVLRWGGGEAITQLVVAVIDPPVTIVDLRPNEREFVAWAPVEGVRLEADSEVDLVRIAHVIEGRMQACDWG